MLPLLLSLSGTEPLRLRVPRGDVAPAELDLVGVPRSLPCSLGRAGGVRAGGSCGAGEELRGRSCGGGSWGSPCPYSVPAPWGGHRLRPRAALLGDRANSSAHPAGLVLSQPRQCLRGTCSGLERVKNPPPWSSETRSGEDKREGPPTVLSVTARGSSRPTPAARDPLSPPSPIPTRCSARTAPVAWGSALLTARARSQTCYFIHSRGAELCSFLCASAATPGSITAFFQRLGAWVQDGTIGIACSRSSGKT